MANNRYDNDHNFSERSQSQYDRRDSELGAYDREGTRDYGRSEYYGQGTGNMGSSRMRSGGYMGPDSIHTPSRMFSSPDSTSYGREDYRGSMSDMGYAGRGPKGYRRSDERIHEEVCECLERDRYVDASEIEVKVNEGIVTLSGTVENRRAKRHAEDSIEHLSGVKDIRNELSVDQSLFEQAKEMITGESKSSKPNQSTAGIRH